MAQLIYVLLLNNKFNIMRNLLIIILALSVLTGCTENAPTGKSIAEMTTILTGKTWRFDVPVIQEKVEKYKHKMNPGQQTITKTTMKRLQFATIEFMENNAINLDFNDGKNITTGTWVFTKDGASLILTFSSVSAVAHKIIAFGDDKIHLEENMKLGLLYPKIFVPLAEGAGMKQSKSSATQEKEGEKKIDLKKE